MRLCHVRSQASPSQDATEELHCNQSEQPEQQPERHRDAQKLPHHPNEARTERVEPRHREHVHSSQQEQRAHCPQRSMRIEERYRRHRSQQQPEQVASVHKPRKEAARRPLQQDLDHKNRR
jgi:hypothetical protein